MLCRPVLLLVCLVALLLGAPRASITQEVLTLQQALSEARARNPDLRAERLRLNVASSQQTLAGLLLPYNPEFEFESASDRLFGNRGNGGYSLSLSQEIEIAGQRGKRKRIANMALDRVHAEIARFEQLLTGEVKIAYHRLALSTEKLKVGDTILTLNERLSVAAERRYRAGDISELEVNLIAAELGLAAAERSRLEAESLAALADLNLLLGLPEEQTTAVRADTTFMSLNLGLDQLVRLSLEKRQDLVATSLEEQAAQKGIDLALASAIPNPKISLTYDQESTVFTPDDFTGDPAIIGGIGGIRDRDRLFRVQVALPLPLLNRNQAGVQQAKAEKNVARATREALEQRIRMEVTSAYRRFIGAKQAQESYRLLLPRVEQNADLLVKAYEAGELDLTVLLVQTDRISRMRLAYFDVLFAYCEALARLEQAVGGPLKAATR